MNPEGNFCTHHPDDPAHGSFCALTPCCGRKVIDNGIEDVCEDCGENTFINKTPWPRLGDYDVIDGRKVKLKNSEQSEIEKGAVNIECAYCGENKYVNVPRHLNEMENYFLKLATDLKTIADDCTNSGTTGIAHAGEKAIDDARLNILRKIRDILWFENGETRHYTSEGVYEHFRKEFPEIITI